MGWFHREHAWRIASAFNIDVNSQGGRRGLEQLVFVLFPSRIWEIICIFVCICYEEAKGQVGNVWLVFALY